MIQIPADTVVEAMNWRYATKRFDRSKDLSEADKSALLAVLRLSPSSYGLQPWKFLVVNDQSIRRKLGEIVPANKSKFEDSSMLVVLARRRATTAEQVAQHVQMIQEARGVSVEDLQPFKDMVIQSATSRTAASQDTWNARQVYVALGCALTAAAMLKIDACPMEGVIPERFDEILGLAGTEFTTTVAIAFGYRDEKDPFGSYPRTRRAAAELIHEV